MLGVQSLGPLPPRRIGEDVIRETSRVGESVRVVEDAEVGSERDAWVTLLAVPGLGPITFAALLAAFGSARAVLDVATQPAGPSRLREALAAAAVDAPDQADEGAVVTEMGPDPEADAGEGPSAGIAPAGSGARHGRRAGLGADLARRICESVELGARAVEQVRSLGLTVVTLDDPGYPERLRRVEMPPPLLFVRGSVDCLGASHSIAVVGTR
jgi:predicted Rossmann fold nucleotide-binding protein DprA/Smf involved in DNA uptake